MLDDQFNDFAYKEFEGRLFAIRDAKTGWNAGVQAERERIKAIILGMDKTLGITWTPEWIQCVNVMMEKINE